MGMGKRGRAGDKGKQEDDLIGIIKGVAISPSSLFVGLRTALRAVACDGFSILVEIVLSLYKAVIKHS